MTRNILAGYLDQIARIHATGAGTGEISYYGALANALNAIGETLKPRVFCVPNLRNRGAGFPDMGLFPVARGKAPADWPEGQPPERGVVEVDDIPADLAIKQNSGQVERYLVEYGLVLVTNYREFVLLGRDPRGRPEVRERFGFNCPDAVAFFALARSTKRPAGLAMRFAEFLERVLLHQAPLGRPEDVAFFLASYARDALARIEEKAALPAFANLRAALQEALGLTFDGPKGEHLFRSTLVQTLFYGLFSAWVETAPAGDQAFDWHAAGWTLHVPFIDTLFQQIATPQRLKPLGLEEPLDWAAAALGRVDRAAFFARFDKADAVRYFYEPFLAAFDPVLRKELGVWYTPREIVRYMVERVDRVLREELGVADGLADPNVWILDPCCGTGAYLVEVLACIERTLRAKGEDALLAEDLKTAATTRIAGFEIMPAPYVIAHWQMGHALRAAGAALADEERAAIYLTNALTGWAAPVEEAAAEAAQKGIRFTFPPLADERDGAAKVKRERPILVVLGNPPYNAYAGTSPKEEAGLVEPYKAGLQAEWGIRKFNLDDLYVRFFRIAERRIAEGTGRGVVCFISNHSWLRYPSFVVMRQRLLSQFDRIWIDNLNGSKFETGKVAPDGSPDPSVFSTEANREGIQVGTAIGLLVKLERDVAKRVRYRDLWGAAKCEMLSASLGVEAFDAQYAAASPGQDNRLALVPSECESDYTSWPKLSDLAELAPFSGALEKRRALCCPWTRRRLPLAWRDTSIPKLTSPHCVSKEPGRCTTWPALMRPPDESGFSGMTTFRRRQFGESRYIHSTSNGPTIQTSGPFGTSHARSLSREYSTATVSSSRAFERADRTKAFPSCGRPASQVITSSIRTRARCRSSPTSRAPTSPAPPAFGSPPSTSPIPTPTAKSPPCRGCTRSPSVMPLRGFPRTTPGYVRTGRASRCPAPRRCCAPPPRSAPASPRWSIPTCKCLASPKAPSCRRCVRSRCRRSAAAGR